MQYDSRSDRFLRAIPGPVANRSRNIAIRIQLSESDMLSIYRLSGMVIDNNETSWLLANVVSGARADTYRSCIFHSRATSSLLQLASQSFVSEKK